MIKSFRDEETKKLFRGIGSRKIDISIQKTAHRKLIMLNNAVNLMDLKNPPNNDLQILDGRNKNKYQLEGYWSIKINKQYRICFEWKNNDCYDVFIIDYH